MRNVVRRSQRRFILKKIPAGANALKMLKKNNPERLELRARLKE